MGWHIWDLNSRLPATIHTENIKYHIWFSVTCNNIHIHITRFHRNPALWPSITSKQLSHILHHLSKHCMWWNSRCIDFQIRLWNIHKRPTQYFAKCLKQCYQLYQTQDCILHFQVPTVNKSFKFFTAISKHGMWNTSHRSSSASSVMITSKHQRMYEYIHAATKTGIRSEKCIVWGFHHCVHMYLHKPREYSIAYYTPRLYGIAYCS